MGTHNLFAYGTLQHPSIITYVIGRVPHKMAARLPDYVRYRIRDADYPGIFPKKDCEVDGCLFSGITEGELVLLDRYESDLYERRIVNVRLTEGNSALAFAYVLPPAHESVCTEELWDLNQYHPPKDPV